MWYRMRFVHLRHSNLVKMEDLVVQNGCQSLPSNCRAYLEYDGVRCQFSYFLFWTFFPRGVLAGEQLVRFSHLPTVLPCLALREMTLMPTARAGTHAICRWRHVARVGHVTGSRGTCIPPLIIWRVPRAAYHCKATKQPQTRTDHQHPPLESDAMDKWECCDTVREWHLLVFAVIDFHANTPRSGLNLNRDKNSLWFTSGIFRKHGKGMLVNDSRNWMIDGSCLLGQSLQGRLLNYWSFCLSSSYRPFSAVTFTWIKWKHHALTK